MVGLSSAMLLRTLHLERCRNRRSDTLQLPSLDCPNISVLPAVSAEK